MRSVRVKTQGNTNTSLYDSTHLYTPTQPNPFPSHLTRSHNHSLTRPQMDCASRSISTGHRRKPLGNRINSQGSQPMRTQTQQSFPSEHPAAPGYTSSLPGSHPLKCPHRRAVTRHQQSSQPKIPHQNNLARARLQLSPTSSLYSSNDHWPFISSDIGEL